MKILHLKYKMHKLVNLFFYLIIFGVGFLLGFGAEKIDFNKFISQFLFIDNVNAYTFYEGTDYIFDEEYVYNLFSTNENFNINKFKYFYCYLNRSSSSNSYLECLAFTSDDVFDNNVSSFDSYYKFTYLEEFEHLYFLTRFKYSGITSETVTYNYLKLNDTLTIQANNTDYRMSLSNFDISSYSNGSNLLDFSSYISSSGNDNENTGDNEDNEDVEIEIVNSGFYEFAQKIFGEVGEENKFIYDFITFGLVVTCFTLFILIVGYIFNKFFGG